MTVVLAYTDHKNNQSWIGGDSCASDSISHSIVKNQKVFHPVGRKDVVMGCAGTFRLPNLLQYVPGVFPPEDELPTEKIDMSYLVNEFTPILNALTDDFDDDDAWELLIAVNGKIYRVQMDLSVVESSGDADAIGIGGPVALGAFKVLNELKSDMSIEERIKYALNVACDSVQGCMPPFLVEKTEQLSDETLKKAREFSSDALTCGYSIIRHKEEESEDKPKKKNKKKKQ